MPIFIVRRKDVTIAAPTLLCGYGGFGIPQVLYYNPIHLAWVEQGGVLAIAGIRGGGEYGRAWHRAGKLANKQNSFDDSFPTRIFVLGASDLHYDSPKRLCPLCVLMRRGGILE